MQTYAHKFSFYRNKKTEHWGASVQPLLQWKGNEYFTTCACIRSPR